jgi:glycosyltransferase involved in cell wall biosynthesis
MKPLISIIVPTRNRCALIGSTISALTTQTLNDNLWELLIVDNGSTDKTCEIAQPFTKSFSNVFYIYESEPGLHSGRHRGLRCARGDILVYADDDIEPFPTWLEAIADAFSDDSIVLVGGNNIPVFYGSPPAWLLHLWNRKGDGDVRSIPWLSIQENPSGRRETSPYMVWGCNFAIRKEILLAAGGFHPDGMPQELIRFRGDGETHVSRFIAENNFKCLFDARASVFHKVTPERMTLAYFRKRGFNEGISDSYFALRNAITPPLARKGISNILKKFREKLITLLPKSANATEMKLPIDAYETGYTEGYEYHRESYAKEKELRDWVHRENYL